MKKIYIIGMIFIVVIIIAIYVVKKQVEKLFDYCYNINYKKIKINKISKDNVNISLGVDFKNTSDLNLFLSKYSFDILVNGKKVSSVSNKQDFEITKNAWSTLLFDIDFSPSKLVKERVLTTNEALWFITDKSKIVFTIVGKVNAGTKGIKMVDVPIEIKMSLAEMLQPSAENPKCKK